MAHIALADCFKKWNTDNLWEVMEIRHDEDRNLMNIDDDFLIGESLRLIKSKFNPLKMELQALQVDLPIYFRKVYNLKMDLIKRTQAKGKKKAEEKYEIDERMHDVAESSTTEAKETINFKVQCQLAVAIENYRKKALAPPFSKKVKV